MESVVATVKLNATAAIETLKTGSAMSVTMTVVAQGMPGGVPARSRTKTSDHNHPSAPKKSTRLVFCVGSKDVKF